MSNTNTLSDALTEVDGKIQAAVAATTADAGASPVLQAVVEDFGRKSSKAVAGGGRDNVIELEQAGDSAKYAAEADTGVSAATRESVLAAHLAICILKNETG